MNQINTTLTKCTRYQPNRLSWFFALLAAVMILVGQSAAVGATSGSDGLGWLEICGDSDTQFAPSEGSSDERTCAHCDYCTVHNGASPDVLFGSAWAPACPVSNSIFTQSDQSLTVLRAEQYWAANRGPPKMSKENTMTNLISLVSKERAVSGVNQWRFPWA